MGSGIGLLGHHRGIEMDNSYSHFSLSFLKKLTTKENNFEELWNSILSQCGLLLGCNPGVVFQNVLGFSKSSRIPDFYESLEYTMNKNIFALLCIAKAIPKEQILNAKQGDIAFSVLQAFSAHSLKEITHPNVHQSLYNILSPLFEGIKAMMKNDEKLDSSLNLFGYQIRQHVPVFTSSQSKTKLK